MRNGCLGEIGEHFVARALACVPMGPMIVKAVFRVALISSIALGMPPVHAVGRAIWADRVEEWCVQEIVLSSGKVYANPFADVGLQAEFRSGKKTVRVEGFYDGGDRWKVRFMPSETGVWKFTTRSSDASLNGVHGRFTVDSPGSANHGPVHVAKTYHFDYADGTPYFLLGTTSYNWLNRDQGLQDRTLAALGQSGFTKLRFGLFPKWYEFNRVDPPIFPFVRTNSTVFDFERFEPSFFENVEKRIVELGKIGVEADVILFHPYDKWGFATMDQRHDEAYLRYVVARLSAYRNVWWTMANEYDLMTPRDWDRLTKLVHDRDPYHHLIGIHNYAVWYDHGKPWIDHVILQDGISQSDRSATIARRRYNKPVAVDEYGYEGNNANGWGELTGPEEVARHWAITMAGAYASHGETYVHPNGLLWWAAGGNLEGESPARLAFLRTVMTSMPFQEMAPAPELVVNGTVLAKPGQTYLLYVPWKQQQLRIAPTQVRLAGADLFKVELIDPWRMRIYTLGYTVSGDQAFVLPMMPALVRITVATHSEAATQTINALVANFVGETPAEMRADPDLFKKEVLTYSSDFQIAQIQHSPAAAAVLAKYLPNTVLQDKRLGVLPVTTLPMAVPSITQQQIEEAQAELVRIPVE
jgi:hypothetical protein